MVVATTGMHPFLFSILTAQRRVCYLSHCKDQLKDERHLRFKEVEIDLAWEWRTAGALFGVRGFFI
jgi:hypothetical protein